MARSKGVTRSGETDGGGSQHAVEKSVQEMRLDDMPEEIRRVLKEDEEKTAELPLDDIFELLKNRRRREVIKYLRRAEDESATLDELAEFIAAKENDIEIQQLSSDQRKRVYIGLYQCHLPKMDELGIVDFEKNRGTIELNDTVEQLEPYLDRVDETTVDPAPTVELAVTAVVIAVLTTAVLGLGPLAALPPVTWAAISTAALIGIAFYRVAKFR